MTLIGISNPPCNTGELSALVDITFAVILASPFNERTNCIYLVRMAYVPTILGANFFMQEVTRTICRENQEHCTREESG